MGTNYYLDPPKDGKLASEMVEHIHIAKLSGGWRASFQSYGVNSERTPYAEVNDRLHISSVSEVKALIERALSEGWEFVDEYDVITDVAAFWAEVESKQSQRSHTEGETRWISGTKPMTYFSFLSDDGYDFNYGDFS
jgi:hypothetical protein